MSLAVFWLIMETFLKCQVHDRYNKDDEDTNRQIATSACQTGMGDCDTSRFRGPAGRPSPGSGATLEFHAAVALSGGCNYIHGTDGEKNGRTTPGYHRILARAVKWKGGTLSSSRRDSLAPVCWLGWSLRKPFGTDLDPVKVCTESHSNGVTEGKIEWLQLESSSGPWVNVDLKVFESTITWEGHLARDRQQTISYYSSIL